MKLYKMLKTEYPKYGYVVFSASYLSPLDQMGEIEQELARNNYSGLVVFDMLLSTGNRDGRFQEIFFDGKSLCLRSVREIDNLTEELNRFALDFYYKNFDELDTSILTRPTRFKLRRGLNL